MQFLFYFPYQQCSSGSSSSMSQGIFGASGERSSAPRALFLFSGGIVWALAIDMRPGKQAFFKDYYTEWEMLWRDCANKTDIIATILWCIFNPQEALEGESNLKGLWHSRLLGLYKMIKKVKKDHGLPWRQMCTALCRWTKKCPIWYRS